MVNQGSSVLYLGMTYIIFADVFDFSNLVFPEYYDVVQLFSYISEMFVFQAFQNRQFKMHPGSFWAASGFFQ